jgi:hypothetical protein
MTVVVTHTTPADGTFSATGAAAWNANHTLSGVGTLAEQNANAVAITGGTINGATVGATTPAAGTFTTLTASGTSYLGGSSTSRGVQVDPVASDTTTFTQFTKFVAINEQQIVAANSANLGLVATGGGAVNMRTAASGLLQMAVTNTASAVNYVQVTGAATGGAVAITAQGSDGNIGLNLTTKGTGGFNFAANGTSNSVFTGNSGTHFRVRTDIASASNFWEVFGSSASAILRSTSATQSGLIQSGGTGGIFIQTNAGTTQAAVSHTASAVNYVQVTGAATTAPPAITVQGSDTNIRMNISSKGTESVDILTNNTGTRAAKFTYTASSVNWVQMTGAIAGSSPSYAVAGNDTDIDLTLTPKGAGNVRFGTYTAGILAQTGYITVKDSGGTTRRLLVG